jgi:hypothetical protein
MKFVFQWKQGLLWAAVTVVAGMALFFLVGSQIDYRCKNTDLVTTSCNVYLGFDRLVQGYADFWRHIVAPRCIGGAGPDDCIGPDLRIMLWTLALAGFVVGGTSKQHPPSPGV